MFLVYRIGIRKSGWLDPMLTHVEDPAKSDHPSILSPSTNVFNLLDILGTEKVVGPLELLWKSMGNRCRE
ncbi:unnamed protein product [[Candida] boidinii]|nr:unnamed protein product [[Candida] boidinii]